MTTRRGRPPKVQVPQTHAIEAAVNDVGASLAALLKAYESVGSVTSAQHQRVFKHLRNSLAVIESQCAKSVMLNAVTSGFSLDGPEPDFIGQAQPVPVQRMVPEQIMVAPGAPSKAPQTTAAPPSIPPVGRLSKHAQEPGAGEKLFVAPGPQAPPDVPDEPGVGFIEEKS